MKNFFATLLGSFSEKPVVLHPQSQETSAVPSSAAVASPVSTFVDQGIAPSGGTQSKLNQMETSFVSIAAHELRTPLTSIKGYLSVYMSDYGNSLNADQKDLLGHIRVATEQLLALVENLLNVSRVERQAIAVNLEPMDWQAVVAEVVDEFRERAIQKNIQLACTGVPERILTIKADKVRLTEVVSNLLANAIQYTNPGGWVQVTLEKKDNEVITSIADNGRGIPKEAIGHLFTKFYRVTQSLTQSSNPEGTGLGLYISKAIVELHHGKIWVESEVGKGSTFRFSLPIES